MLSLNRILNKPVELRDEIRVLADMEMTLNSEVSVSGTIEYYENFLAGYMSRLKAGKHLPDADYESIQSYRPFMRDGFLEAYQRLSGDFPRVEHHLQVLEQIRDEVLATQPKN